MEKKIGPTGRFPEGKINEHDEGELRIGIPTDGEKVVVSFGVPVLWLAMTGDQAIELGDALTKHGRKANGWDGGINEN